MSTATTDNDHIHSAIEMTEILTLIASHLPPADQASCTQVCRTWLHPFASQLWRDLKEDQSLWTSLCDALPRYGHFVRKIECCRRFDLSLIGHHCPRLTLFQPPSITMENLNQFLLILVQNHKSINTLAVAFSVELKRSNRSLDKALRIILELDLVSLKIDLEGSLQHGALAYVLEKCPLLEYLSIGDWNETNRPGDLATNNNNNNSPRCCPRLRSFRTRRLKDLHSSILTVAQCAPNLEALEVEDQEGDDDDVGQANVANLLFSPRLENLCVQLRKSCPNLNSLSLNCYAMDSEGIATLLRATPNLKSLRVNEYELPVTLNILVECPDSFPLLESVYLKHYEQTHSSFSNLLGRLLQQKPALRELRVRGHDVVDKSCMELLHPWACKNLETLEVDFGVLDGGLSEQLRVSVCELFNAQLDGLPKFKENPMYPAREIL